MRIGIIGGGVVGSATARAFKDHDMRVYDVDPKKGDARILDVVHSDLVFVCLPTPQKVVSLECDTSVLDSFFHAMSLDDRERTANFVLKSTVPIGYTRKACEKYGLPNLVHSPEFLTARTAKEDACNPTRMVIGYVDGASQCFQILRELYQQRWPKGWDCTDPEDPSYSYPCDPVPIYEMTSDESEAVKLMQNSYSAVVISLLNEFRCLVDKTGMDWDRVMEALLASGWLAPRHTQVPGPDGRRGFGGTCLPKDLANLIQCMTDAGVSPDVCEAANYRNLFIDRKE